MRLVKRGLSNCPKANISVQKLHFQQKHQQVQSVNHLSFKCLQMFKALCHLHKAIKWLTNYHKQAAEGEKAKTCSLCFSQFPFNLRHAFVLSLKAPFPLMASLLSFTLQWQHRISSQQLDAVTKCNTEIYIHSTQIYWKKGSSWHSLRQIIRVEGQSVTFSLSETKPISMKGKLNNPLLWKV